MVSATTLNACSAPSTPSRRRGAACISVGCSRTCWRCASYAPSRYTSSPSHFTAPPSRGYTPYQYRPRVMGGFNPSIAPAPAGLCPRCAYVATVRVEALHQCNRRSPFLTGKPEWPQGFFRGTAVAVLDASLSQVLGWTWFIASPEKQITHAEEAAAPNASLHLLQTFSRWKVPRGAADGFPPPWNQPVYDARLFSLSGQLMITYNCNGCEFSVSHLQITARPTPDGGLHELRAWNEHRLVLPMKINGVRITSNDWLKGRNQALFAVPISQTSAGSLAGEDRRSIRATRAVAASDATSAPPLGLMTQPWFGLVGSLGAPRFKRVRVMCPKNEVGGFHGTCGHLPPGSKPRHLERVIMSPCRGPSCRNVTLPRSILLRPDTFTWLPSRPGPGGGSGGGGRQRRTDAEAQAAAYGDSELRYNHSAQVAALDLGGPRLSTTANLLRVRRLTATASHAATPAAATATASAKHGRCEAYLGIGHVHRGEGGLNRQDRENRKTWRQQRGGGAPGSRGGANATTFMFGYDYTHFFYTLSPVPPYQLLSTSAEFCAGSMQDGNDCESVQFISGLAFGASNLSDAAAGNTGGTGDGPGAGDAGDAGDIARDGAGDIVLSFGVNDCESRLGRIGLARVWSMLVPLPCTTPPCAACAQV